MSDKFETEAIGEMIKDAAQDIDSIELPRDTDNLLVANLEQQIGLKAKLKVF